MSVRRINPIERCAVKRMAGNFKCCIPFARNGKKFEKASSGREKAFIMEVRMKENCSVQDDLGSGALPGTTDHLTEIPGCGGKTDNRPSLQKAGKMRDCRRSQSCNTPFIPGSPSRNDVLMALQPCDLSTGNYALWLLRRMKNNPATPEPSNNTVPGTGTAEGS